MRFCNSGCTFLGGDPEKLKAEPLLTQAAPSIPTISAASPLYLLQVAHQDWPAFIKAVSWQPVPLNKMREVLDVSLA